MTSLFSRRRRAIAVSTLLTTLLLCARPGLTDECFIDAAVDCSTGYLGLAPLVAGYDRAFERACVHHDFCYRYGAETYGHTRNTCDRRFLQDMRKKCRDLNWRDIVTFGLNVGACLAAAEAYHAAVKRLGAGSFETDESRFCEYAGPAARCDADTPGSRSCWTSDFSEEGDGAMRCPDGKAVAGVWCKGSYCDNKSLLCKAFTNEPIPPQRTADTAWISEERPNNVLSAGSGPPLQLITGLKCRGRYCDRLSAELTTAPNSAGTGRTAWLPFFSEEDSGSRCAENDYVTGLQCKGDYCDNLALRCTSVGTPERGRPVGTVLRPRAEQPRAVLR